VKKFTTAVKMTIELHCHNDLGMVVATSLVGARAAIDSGVNAYINTTINGMGGRAMRI
jgi:homocitrate synthase NifV